MNKSVLLNLRLNFPRREDNPQLPSLISLHKFNETIWQSIPKEQTKSESFAIKKKVLSTINNILYEKYGVYCHYQNKPNSLKDLFPALKDYPTFESKNDKMVLQGENGIYLCSFKSRDKYFVLFYLSLDGAKFLTEELQKRHDNIQLERKFIFNPFDNIDAETVYTAMYTKNKDLLKSVMSLEDYSTMQFFACIPNQKCIPNDFLGFLPKDIFGMYGGISNLSVFDAENRFKPENKEEIIFKLRNFLFTLL